LNHSLGATNCSRFPVARNRIDRANTAKDILSLREGIFALLHPCVKTPGYLRRSLRDQKQELIARGFFSEANN
jgi:hypothetical protein